MRHECTDDDTDCGDDCDNEVVMACGDNNGSDIGNDNNGGYDNGVIMVMMMVMIKMVMVMMIMVMIMIIVSYW